MANPEPLTIQFNDEGEIEKVFRGKNVTVTGGKEVTKTFSLEEDGNTIEISHLFSFDLFKHYGDDGRVNWCWHSRTCKVYC